MKTQIVDNMKSELLNKIENIVPADGTAKATAKARQESLAKPPGSLGGLEDITVRLAGILCDGRKALAGNCEEEYRVGSEGAALWVSSDARLDRGCVLVFCADNGVVAQGVSSAPQSVTRAQTMNFTRRLTGVGTLAKSFGSELLIVDMGVKDEIPSELYDDVPLRDTHKIVDRRIRPGTDDISVGPAMTTDEAVRAMMYGIEMAQAAADAGFGILGVGEMGIGNTTTSAAVLSALMGEGSDITCGRGGGVNDEGFKRKCEIVNECSSPWREKGGILRRYPLSASDILVNSRAEEGRPNPSETRMCSWVNEAGNPNNEVCSDKNETHSHETKTHSSETGVRLDDVIEMLAVCSGFDICAMTGAFLGAAMCRTPVVIDGYISVVAALAATTIKPEVRDYMFASHKSAEPGYDLAIETLGLNPFLDLGMRLGEGSGCPIAFAVIKGAWDVMNHMGTFEEAEINDDYLEEVRRGGCF